MGRSVESGCAAVWTAWQRKRVTVKRAVADVRGDEGALLKGNAA